MENKKGNKKIVIIAIIIAAVILIGTAGVLIFSGVFSPKIDNEHKGVVGVISDDWDTGLKEESSETKPGTRIPGYSTAEMKEGDTTLTLSIGNPKANSVGFFATLKLQNGDVLYESELLEPGQGLTEIPLTHTLSKGTYDAAVVYKCVLLDEENTPLNAAESGFELIVN